MFGGKVKMKVIGNGTWNVIRGLSSGLGYETILGIQSARIFLSTRQPPNTTYHVPRFTYHLIHDSLSVRSQLESCISRI